MAVTDHQSDPWELSLPVSLSEDETVERIKQAADLGYSHIAINFIVDVPKDNRNIRIPPKSSFDKLVKKSKLSPKVLCYSRLTLVAEDMSVARVLRDPVVSSYDLLALRPLSEPLLTSACEGQVPVDIISFDVTAWTPNSLRQSLLQSSGLVCEISYGPMIRDSGSRAQTISFSQVLMARAKGGGKGLFALSGETQSQIELRSPGDVANLANFLGLSIRNGWASITDAPKAAHQHSLIRRGIFGVEIVGKTEKKENIAKKRPLSSC